VVTKAVQYTDLQGRTYDLSALGKAERACLGKLQRLAQSNPEWSVYRNSWLTAMDALYAAKGLSRSEIAKSVVYRVGQDLGSRLAIEQGRARPSDYRDELAQLILSRFKTRREFCYATGLSEDMLSHVLARRKHMAIDTLADALQRVGYRLQISPLESTRRGRGQKRRPVR
jgi:hypothetical protein